MDRSRVPGLRYWNEKKSKGQQQSLPCAAYLDNVLRAKDAVPRLVNYTGKE
jgi:hypothetical protein